MPSFLAPLSFAAGPGPGAVAAGDFNGDGIQDLVVTNGHPNYGVSVLLANGDGSFQNFRTYNTGTISRSVAVGDVNGDGILDLAVANSALPGTVSVLLGNGDGTFQAARTFAAGTGPVVSVAVGDFNGDGLLDLAVANEGDYYGTGVGVGVLLGNGDGSFQAPQTIAAGISPYSVVVGDFNSDGLPDLAVTDGAGGVSVLLGNGDGTFQPAGTYAAGRNSQSVAVADFNCDGKLDLVVANYGDDSVSVLLGNGDGAFQAAQNFPAGRRPNSVAVGDFNGDGIPDLAVAGDIYDGTMSVLLGNGDGSFQTARSFDAGSYSNSVAAGDFNGDGRPDLAVANFFSNDVSIFLNDAMWPSAPGGGSSPHAGRRGTILPALAGVLPPRPDPIALPSSPNRGTEAVVPPPLLALDNLFVQTQAAGEAGGIAWPMLARGHATWLPVRDNDLPWADGPEWNGN